MFRRVILMVALAVSAPSAEAVAQVDLGASSPGADRQKQAQKDLAAGQRLLKKGRFEAALTKLQAAYAVEPTGAALLGIAVAERETDRPAEAYRSYEKLLAGPAAELTPEEREGAQRAFAELDAATGTVKLTVSEPGAACALDGRAIDADLCAHPIHLSGGRHMFGATKPGFEPVTFAVLVTVGKVLETSLTLKPQAGAISPGPPIGGAPAPPSAPPPIAAPASPAVPAPPPPTTPPPASPSPPPPAPSSPEPAPAPPVAPVAPAAPPPVAPASPAAPPPSASPPEPPPPVPPISSPPQSTFTPPPEVPVAPIQPSPLAPLPSASAPPFLVPASEQTTTPPPPANAFASGPHIGLMLGIIALPRPIEGEVVVKLGSAFALGLKGSFLPELSVPGVDAKLDLKALEGIGRWFPGDGVFFLGAGVGYQSFKGTIGQSVDGSELSILADMSGFFIEPQLGVLWISSSGFALSFGVGLQIPIPKDPVVTATYNGQQVPTQATSAIPQDVIDQAQTSKDNVQSAARFIVKYPFPTLDLLRIGIFF